MLNYLGYSWIDQGVNLDDGMRMIRRAVEQRPDDGYIVDSLGWAYYRIRQLRRGGEAARARRRAEAARTRPSTIISATPIGRSGARSRRTFQWAHARDLKPEPDDLKKIDEKLRTGLIDEAAPAETAKAGQEAGRRRLKSAVHGVDCANWPNSLPPRSI